MHNIEELQKAIRDLHGCESEYLESVGVKETFKGQIVWEGCVEVFSLTGHPKTDKCYAWSHAESGEKKRFYAVLHLPPVDHPRTAVQAAIVSQHKE